VIFLTAKDSGADVAEGLRRGAHDYLRKPFETYELMARLLVAYRTRLLRDELRERNAKLEQLALTDLVTGVNNRRVMQQQLEALVSHSGRHGDPLAALLIDVDHFKAVNDPFGHDVGDRVLRGLAERFRAPDTRRGCIRALGRRGVPRPPVFNRRRERADAAEDLCLVAREPIIDDEGPVTVTISIGIAEAANDSPPALFKCADDALYRAKAAGRNRVHGGEPAHARA
jgi:PleD family two-component response regulator